MRSQRSQDRKWITIVKVNLVEECHRNCDKISGCCPLCEIHTFHGAIAGAMVRLVFIAGSSETHSVCVCTTHQNTILLVDTLNWEVTCKDLVYKAVCDPSNCECMMHRYTNFTGTNALRKFLEEELRDMNLDFQLHYSQWQITERASLVTVTSTCE